jgi:hypothetical protein
MEAYEDAKKIRQEECKNGRNSKCRKAEDALAVPPMPTLQLGQRAGENNAARGLVAACLVRRGISRGSAPERPDEAQ